VPKDGETLFRGLIFGEGEVAQAFPEIWGGKKIDDPSWTAEQREAVVKTKALLISDMRTADPGFFDRYAAALQSGDRLRIERMLDESGKLFRQVADSRITTSQSGNSGSASGTCIIEVLFVVVAVFINVAADLNFVTAWNFVLNRNLVYNTEAFWGGGGGGITDPGDDQQLVMRLQRDQVVNMLAVRLAQ
jgi:SdpC family antimicrobial peptide